MQKQSLPFLGLGLHTEFYEGVAKTEDSQAIGKIVGPLEAIAIIIKNRLVNLDNTSNPLELLVGTGGGTVWPLLPGEESPIIYVVNLNDVFVKVRVAVSTGDTEGEILTFDVADGGVGYAINDLVTVDAGDGNAVLKVTAVINGIIFTATLNAGGALYMAGDVLGVSGGGANATVEVDTVDGGGAILTFHIVAGGSGYAVAAGVNLTGGTGAGGKINITVIHNGEISTMDIIDSGSGYVVAAGVALIGGSGDGAEIDILTVDNIEDRVAFPFMVYVLDSSGER